MQPPFDANEVLDMKAIQFVDADAQRIFIDETWSSIQAKVKGNPDSTAIVIDHSNRIKGIITDQDLLDAISKPEWAEKIKDDKLTAQEIMQQLGPDSDTVSKSSEEIRSVIAKMRGQNSRNRPFKIIPLVDSSGSLIGQISKQSINKALDGILEE